MQSSHSYSIFFDAPQEVAWFKELVPELNNAQIIKIPINEAEKTAYGLERILKYDKPDIILKDFDQVILVLERTKEVPSGHNVGQRFGRLIAAAEESIPCLYFFPYKAYKHGGKTAGVRYVNLRLFSALEKVSDYYDTVITTVNWPVDDQNEVLITPEKDERVKTYLRLFFDYYNKYGMDGIVTYIRRSSFQEKQRLEQIDFANNEIKNPDQYNDPPESVEIMSVVDFKRIYCNITPFIADNIRNIEVYNIGMSYIRSDPYAGMAMLYYYLYGADDLIQILNFENIEYNQWVNLGHNTKTYRMFRAACAGILFKDGLVMQSNL